MAITALATQNTTIGPAQFADMTEVLTARFKVDGANHLKPSIGYSGAVSVSAGAGTAGGSRVRSTGTETVTIPSVSFGQMWYSVCLRVDWSTSVAQLVAIKGTSSSLNINTSSAPNPNSVNRIPGVMYDALICNVLRTPTGISSLMDMRMVGGDGGPYIVSDACMGSPGSLDARPGTWIATDQSVLTKRLDADGVWRPVGTQSNPWKTWTPTLRYYGKDAPNGVSGGTVASLGNGYMSGRYRIVDGMLDGYAYIYPGVSGANLGVGVITMDLPVACANWQEDTWSMGHLFSTTSYGGDKNLDWHMEMLVKKGWTRGLLFAPFSGLNNDMKPYQMANGVDPKGGTSIPRLASGIPIGPITMHVNYPVDV
nr:MAG TPA: hypothetical protein [Caudoviricetes sp.]